MNRSHFYFTAQTGVIRNDPPAAPSNFHVYRLANTPENHARVWAAVDCARYGSAGLEYSAGFLAWLDEHDESAGGK